MRGIRALAAAGGGATLLALAVAPSAQARQPRLTRNAAKAITGEVIAERLHYGPGQRAVLPHAVRCQRRSRISFRCEWKITDERDSYAGRGVVKTPNRLPIRYWFHVRSATAGVMRWHSPPPQPIRMTRALAERALGTELLIRFKERFGQAFDKKARCRRVSARKFRCHPSWTVGDWDYFGRATIWNPERYKLLGGGHYTAYHYSWRIKRFDEYCAATHHRHCVRTYIVR